MYQHKQTTPKCQQESGRGIILYAPLKRSYHYPNLQKQGLNALSQNESHNRVCFLLFKIVLDYVGENRFLKNHVYGGMCRFSSTGLTIS